jgi:hypothetical protein
MKYSLTLALLIFSFSALCQCEIEVDDIAICQNQMAIASIIENEETIELMNTYSVETIDLEYDTLLKSSSSFLTIVPQKIVAIQLKN